jgi:hypothetical protein
VGCWNAIAVQAVRLATPYQLQGLLYMGYTQAAVYDAVTKIEGRYVPYDDFTAPAGAHVRSASPDAATAAAAYTILTSSFLGLPAAAQVGLATKYSDYIDALGGVGAPTVAGGIAVGQAAANDLIADRAGDRDESITFTPGPLTAGGWTFAPLPSLQSAQTPWAAVMKPFMLTSPSQFRADPPPALSSRKRANDFNEVKAYGAVNSSARSAEQTAIAQFWNANAVSQSNQAFQDVALAHGMDLVDAAARDGRSDRQRRGDRVLGLQVPLPVLAPGDGDPQRRDRRQSRHPARCGLDAAAHHPQPPRIPGRAHVSDRRRGRHVLRRARDAPHRGHHPRLRRRHPQQLRVHPDVHARPRPATPGRQRPRLGGPSLPRFDRRRPQARP